MPLDANGMYYESTGFDKAYEAESAYYLNFHIVSALVSLSHLNSSPTEGLWENRSQYYHYYADHLLYALGQIANRFVFVDKDDSESMKLRKERKEQNRINYHFSEEEYPIISQKKARNTVEHIDEHDQAIILQYHGVGGFNMIDSQTESDLVTFLREHKDSHPYTLDLLQNKLMLKHKGENLEIDLNALKAELVSLQEKVKAFQHKMSAITLI